MEEQKQIEARTVIVMGRVDAHTAKERTWLIFCSISAYYYVLFREVHVELTL